MSHRLTTSARRSTAKSLPRWLRKRLVSSSCFSGTAGTLKSLGVTTVCKEAKCPNINECFSAGTATFMIMGDQCTRHCAFCAVASSDQPSALDPGEPQRIAQAVEQMALRYAVVTSVTRDDLPDGGAEHFFQTIRAISDLKPACRVEVLTPDFAGQKQSVELVCSALPAVYNHNLETVQRLTPRIRSGADYNRSLQILAWAGQAHPTIRTKSGLMLGLGETDDEIIQAMQDLRAVGCDLLTIGQYLRPTADHMEVVRYVEPKTFEQYEQTARDLGFLAVAAGPFVRSSYQAGQLNAL